MKKFKRIAGWAIGLSSMSLLIAVTMIAMWICESRKICVVELDSFVGVIVALLAIIVTFVLGWQIFNIFELKHKIDEVNELKTQFKEQQEKIIQLSMKNKHITGYTWGKTAIKEKNWRSAFRYLILSLSASLQLDSPINVDSIFEMLRKVSQNIPSHSKFLKVYYQEVIDADKEIRLSHSFSLIEKTYNMLYNNILSKIEIDDDQK